MAEEEKAVGLREKYQETLRKLVELAKHEIREVKPREE